LAGSGERRDSLAAGAIVNAVWDLYARSEGKPVWKLLVDMTPEEIVSCIPFRHITDALTPREATEILRRNEPTKMVREVEMRAQGYPAYRPQPVGSAMRTKRCGNLYVRGLARAGRTSDEGWP